MNRTKIILLVIIAVAIAAIVSMRGDASTYVAFKEAQSNPGESFHVVGKLERTAPMSYNPMVDANLFTFYLKDNEGKTCKVIYQGTKPENFEQAEQVVVVGQSKGNDQFHAHKILTKCPSKYEKEAPVAASL